MPNAEDIRWFKEQFHKKIEAGVAGSPFTVDMITAIACQETGFIWQTLRKTTLTVAQILELCVGDTLDANKGRKAFPKTKADLVAAPRGPEMFAIARQALVDMAKFIGGFGGAVANPDKFCHGFGIFQLDLQFFKDDPDYFLEKRYADFDACFGKCVGELKSAQQAAKLGGRSSLTDLEMAHVAIAYNTGGFNPSKGLKQGHSDGSKFYGEAFFDFLRLAHTVVLEDESPPPPPGEGPLFRVQVSSSPLRLRSEPRIDESDANAGVIGRLPNGHIVRGVGTEEVSGFLEVQTTLSGEELRGFASAQFLKPVS